MQKIDRAWYVLNVLLYSGLTFLSKFPTIDPVYFTWEFSWWKESFQPVKSLVMCRDLKAAGIKFMHSYRTSCITKRIKKNLFLPLGAKIKDFDMLNYTTKAMKGHAFPKELPTVHYGCLLKIVVS